MSTTLTETRTTTPALTEVLRRGAWYLEEFGWCQGEIGGPGMGRMCVGAAVAVAYNDLHGRFPLMRWNRGDRLDREPDVDLAGILGARSVQAWNDNARRTKDEVVGALLGAADALA
jgi:hypothetical protein